MPQRSGRAASRSRWKPRILYCYIAGATAVVATSAPDPRADFLRLIDRPRVALDAQVEPAAGGARDGVVETSFSYMAEAGQRVPGIIIAPAVVASKPRPVVIALHGTGGNKESQRAFLTELAKAGFVGIAIDARYHGARHGGKGNPEYNAALVHAFRTGAEHPFFYDTVWDVMRLIDYIQTRPDLDATRVGLFGISKGGIETYLTAAVDPRVAVAVPCIAVESFRWALDHDSWHSRIGTVQAAFDTAAKDAGVAKPGADFVRTFYDRVAPGIYSEFDGPAMVPWIAPRPLLAVNGEIDPRTPMGGLNECADAARAAYGADGASDKFVLLIQPKTAHQVRPESLVTAREWFVRWLKP